MKVIIALGIVSVDEQEKWKSMAESLKDLVDSVYICDTGESLLETARTAPANIIITELSLPGIFSGNIVDQIKDSNGYCYLIGLGSGENFNELMTAMRLGMNDFLVPPVSTKSLAEALLRAEEKLNRDEERFINSQYRIAARQLYATKLYKTQRHNADIDTVNSLMCTNFHGGYYQTILLCADYPGDHEKYNMLLPGMQRKWLEVARNLIGDQCYDILYDNSKEGLVLLLNYPRRNKDAVYASFERILSECKGYAEKDIILSLMIGGAYDVIDGFSESRTDTRIAKWSRISAGVGGILYDGTVEYMPEYADRIEDIFKNMYKAIDTVNLPRFERLSTQLFLIPRDALSRYRVRERIAELISYFIESNRQILSKYFDMDTLFSKIDDSLDIQWTVKRFEASFKQWFEDLFEDVRYGSDSRNDIHVRKAKQYIEENYNADINVGMVADSIGLSSVYFSHLFKVKTGQNFTEYVCNYRIEKSKKMLRETEMNISEISAAAGFSDTRYFSRKFKELTGMTPTQFRKIYNV